MSRSIRIGTMVLILLVLVPMATGGCSCPDWSFGWGHPDEDEDSAPPLSGTVGWTADGESVVFVVAGGSERVYVVPAEGGQVVEHDIPTGNDAFIDVRISPDGDRIAFVSSESCASKRNPRKLYTMNKDGSRTRKVMDIPFRLDGRRTDYAFGLAWSPDSQALAFAVNIWGEEKGVEGEDALAVYTVEADGSDKRMVTRVPGEYAGGLAWSPDGQLLSFVSGQVQGRGDFGVRPVTLHTLSVRDAELSQQSLHSQTVGLLARDLQIPLAWSPDGREMAFAVWDSDGLKLYGKTLGESDLRVLADMGPVLPAESVAWSPDGSRILLSIGGIFGGLQYLTEADGSNIQVVGIGTGSWAPGGSRVATLDINLSNNVWVHTTAPDGGDLRVLAHLAQQPHQVDGEYFIEVVGVEQRSPADPGACSAGVVVAEPEGNPVLVQDCEVLMRLRDRLAPKTILNWDAGTPIGEWHGVTVEESSSSPGTPLQPRVTGITLSGLNGFLPPDIARLTELHTLDISRSRILGPIPQEITSLTNLVTLDLGDRLFGSTPLALGSLKNLRTLSLSLSGPISPELGNLTELVILDLSNGRLSGPIPPEFGNLTELVTLNLGRNDLSGPIPPELGNLTELVTLNLRGNDLSGPIPPELGNLQSLERLTLPNGLTGCAPEALYERFVSISGDEYHC